MVFVESSVTLANSGTGELVVSASLPAHAPSWMLFTPILLNIPPGESRTLPLAATTVDLPPDTYVSVLRVNTNIVNVSTTPQTPTSLQSSASASIIALLWSLQVLEVLVFPVNITKALSPDDGRTQATVTIVNFAGTPVLVTASVPDSALSVNFTSIVPIVVMPGALGSVNIEFGSPLTNTTQVPLNIACWKAADGDSSNTSVVADVLSPTPLDDVSDVLAAFPLSSAVTSMLTPTPLLTVQRLIGSPSAAHSRVVATSPLNAAPVTVTVALFDVGGQAVPYSEEASGALGVITQPLSQSVVWPQPGILIAQGSSNHSAVITITPTVAAPFEVAVQLSDVTVIGGAFTVNLTSQHCAPPAYSLAGSGFACLCSPGYFLFHSNGSSSSSSVSRKTVIDTARCVPCPAGTYKPAASNGTIDMCLLCPAERYCVTGSALPFANCPTDPLSGFACVGGVLTLREGYWSGNVSSLRALHCANARSCKQQAYTSASNFTIASSSGSKASSLVQQLCSDGYSGPACAACSSGTSAPLGGHCIPCGNASLGFMIAALLLVAGIVVCAVAWHTSMALEERLGVPKVRCACGSCCVFVLGSPWWKSGIAVL